MAVTSSPGVARLKQAVAPRGRRLLGTAAAQCVLLLRGLVPQLVREVVGRTVELLLRDLVGVRDRLVERLVERRLADEDQRGLARIEPRRGVLQLAARQRTL